MRKIAIIVLTTLMVTALFCSCSDRRTKVNSNVPIIELSYPSGGTVYVNADYIEYMGWLESVGVVKQNFTQIRLASGNHINVIETPDEILKLISAT